MTVALLASVQTGRAAPLGPEHVPSGFVKNPRTDAVRVRRLGLEGDEQADLTAHGGPEKAVYAYAASHFPDWAAEFPELAPAFHGGAMGENLTVAGMDETEICVGDVHAVGSALLQVCQPRQPCFKLALRHANNKLGKAMVRRGHAGWYYRVIEEGILRTGDTIALHDRPNPDFPFIRLIEIVHHGKASAEELARMSQMPGLASQWREIARELLG